MGRTLEAQHLTEDVGVRLVYPNLCASNTVFFNIVLRRNFIVCKQISRLLMLCAITLIALTARPVMAGSESSSNIGNGLIKLCNQTNFNDKNMEWYSCLAFVNGVSSGFLVGAGWGYGQAYKEALAQGTELRLTGHEHGAYCIPEGATTTQLGLVVTKYLDDHPANLNLDNVVLIVAALKDAWPCQMKGAK